MRHKSATDSLHPGQLNRLINKIKDSPDKSGGKAINLKAGMKPKYIKNKMKIEIEVESPPEGYSIPKRGPVPPPFKDTLILMGNRWVMPHNALMLGGDTHIYCHKLPKKCIEIEKAMSVLKQAMTNDENYAHTWHCNIAMACYDAIRKCEDKNIFIDAYAVGNDAANRFMKFCFNVETKV